MKPDPHKLKATRKWKAKNNTEWSEPVARKDVVIAPQRSLDFEPDDTPRREIDDLNLILQGVGSLSHNRLLMPDEKAAQETSDLPGGAAAVFYSKFLLLDMKELGNLFKDVPYIEMQQKPGIRCDLASIIPTLHRPLPSELPTTAKKEHVAIHLPKAQVFDEQAKPDFQTAASESIDDWLDDMLA